MKYPNLYTRDSLGNIRIWLMEQEGNKYRTISGLLDGEKVTSEWTVTEGKNSGKKNETTAEKQATKEIEAKYKKQEKTGYFKDVSLVDESKYVEPMLAKNYKDYEDKINFSNKEYGSQTKYNGICCVATEEGCFSRKGEKFLSIDHISEELKEFFNKYPKAFLHGELFNDDYREKLNEIVKLCRKTVNITAEDKNNSKELISFYVYDGCIPEENLNESKSYVERKSWIDKNVVAKFNCCKEVKTTLVENKEQLNKLFEKAIERGDEGLILRKLNSSYEHKRSKNLLKYKPMDSDEMVILEVKEGTGNWSGKAKILTVRMKSGEEFDATFKGDMAAAEKFLNEKDKWINKEVTINYFGFTGLGCPQYAQFDVNNCIRAD